MKLFLSGYLHPSDCDDEKGGGDEWKEKEGACDPQIRLEEGTEKQDSTGVVWTVNVEASGGKAFDGAQGKDLAVRMFA